MSSCPQLSFYNHFGSFSWVDLTVVGAIWIGLSWIGPYLLDLLDLPVLLSHCVAFMTDLNVGQIISNTNSLVLVQF